PRVSLAATVPATGAAETEVGDVRRELAALKERLAANAELLDDAKLAGELEYLEGVSGEDGFWDDPAAARAALARLAAVRAQAERSRTWRSWVEDAQTAVELICDAGGGDGTGGGGGLGTGGGGGLGASEAAALAKEGMAALCRLRRDLDAWELEKLLSGPHDAAGCRLSIQAGAGGTEAQDWAEMLCRMYQRFCQRRGLRLRVVDKEDGEVAGIKSCTMEVEGRLAYGLLAGEKGTHRLVRLSPFNAQAKRQTSFAGVETFPILEEDDLRSVKTGEG
ncbi:unnamed protein product, partial [Phaeothamnion confervicola]